MINYSASFKSINDSPNFLGLLTVSIIDPDKENSGIYFNSILSHYKTKSIGKNFVFWRPLYLTTGEIRDYNFFDNFINMMCTASSSQSNWNSFTIELLYEICLKLGFEWEIATIEIPKSNKEIECTSLKQYLASLEVYVLPSLIQEEFCMVSYVKESTDNPDINKKSFIVTGNFDIIDRMDLINYIECNGGTVRKNFNQPIDYIIVGNNFSQKLATEAQNLKIPEISDKYLIDFLK